MANDFGNMASPRVVMKFIDLLHMGYPFLFRANAIHRDMPAKRNDTVTASYPIGGEAQDWPGTAQGANLASIPVKLDMWRVHRFTLNPKEITQLHEGRESIVDKLAINAVKVLMSDAMGAIRKQVTPANFTEAVTLVPANFGYDELIDLRAKLNKNRASLGRFVILGPSMFAALVKDPTITNKQTNLDNINTVGTARVEKVAGFDVFEDPDWDEGANLFGFASGDESIAIATAVPDISLGSNHTTSHVKRAVVGDEESGFKILCEEWDDPDEGYTVRLSFLLGVGTNDKQKDHALRLVNA